MTHSRDYPVASIDLYRYRIFLSPLEPLTLPEFKGGTLRGVFGHALRAVACTIQGEECPRCPFRFSCAYAMLFDPSPPPNFPDGGKFSAFPRPYVMNAPFSRKTVYAKDEAITFEVVLVGAAGSALPQVLTAFESIGRQGLKNGRGRFQVARVESVDSSGCVRTICTDGELTGEPIPIRVGGDVPAGDGFGSVVLHFVTPTRFDIEGSLCDTPPPFREIVRSIHRRASLLGALFCGIPFEAADLPPDADGDARIVQVIDHQIQWTEWERYSSKQKERLKQGGIVGAVVYHGPVSRFLPLLRLAEQINIGKSTTFGLGRVVISAS